MRAQTNDEAWLALACELAGRCPRSDTAYSVGAVIVGPDGEELATGHSRETDPTVHAEECALRKVRQPLTGATLYSSLEPCSQRRSRPRSCTDLILDTEIARVVIAWREPSVFVENCVGVERLAAAGVTVVHLDGLESLARAPNAHLLSTPRAANPPESP